MSARLPPPIVFQLATLLKPRPQLRPLPPRYITRLLEDLVYFVICKENPGGQRPDPITLEGVPDRDRQKLVREQDVLKEVMSALRD